MESGTLWQLSLLKRLSSVSPSTNYLAKFKHFRSLDKHTSRKHSLTINTSRQLFRKYPQSQRQLTCGKDKLQSLQRKSNRLKKQRVPIRESMNLSGWNVQNEEAIMYPKLLQKNNFSFFENQLKRIKKRKEQRSRLEAQKKFSYVKQDLSEYFKQSNKQTIKRDARVSGPRNKKLKPLIIDQINTQQNTYKCKDLTQIDKQNLPADQLVLICCSSTHKIEAANKVRKIIGLIKGFSSQLNRQRIC